MSESIVEDEACKVCGTKKSQHAGMNHEFSLDGQLKKVTPSKPVADRVVVMVDAHLRKILVRKGILTAEDFLE